MTYCAASQVAPLDWRQTVLGPCWIRAKQRILNFMAFEFLKRLFDNKSGRDALTPLYTAIVEEARQPEWYAVGQVPDTLDGRFDMLAAVGALVMVRLEAFGEEGRNPQVMLTEIFVDDMDGQLRETGMGDLIVGKHVGRMLAALGGRIGAYRDGMESDEALSEALVRNLYRGIPPEPAALTAVTERMKLLEAELKIAPLEQILAGRIRT
jgi:cytochrome b pre-mRNA-processing protein 3